MTEEIALTKPKRRRSGTADWHMSRTAVSVSVFDVVKWTDKECLNYLVEVRFGGWGTVSCPHCGTIGKHYWRALEKRWKCQGCGSTFSVTSGTVFSRHRKPLQQIISSVLMWLNSAAGQPALELKRHLNTTYNTAFTLQHKMREALVRGYNVGLMNGDVEMDGAHQSGRRAAEKRGKPQVSQAIDAATPESQLTKIMLSKQEAKSKNKEQLTGAVDPEYGQKLPEDRRILFALRKRSGVRGKGASTTRVAVGLVENDAVAKAITKDFLAVPESYLNTDTHPAYTDLGKGFRLHRTVAHAKQLSGPNGENNNQAEELNARYDRAEKGIYLNIEPKYLLDYAVETSFRSDTRRLPNGKQLQLAMCVALSVGKSQFWQGFTKGRHRTLELLHPTPQPAPASGPKKGRNPFSSASGRPPR